jgi:hypothetical protein
MRCLSKADTQNACSKFSSYVVHLACSFFFLFFVLAEACHGAHIVVVFTLGTGFICGVFASVSLDVLCEWVSIPFFAAVEKGAYPSL